AGDGEGAGPKAAKGKGKGKLLQQQAALEEQLEAVIKGGGSEQAKAAQALLDATRAAGKKAESAQPTTQQVTAAASKVQKAQTASDKAQSQQLKLTMELEKCKTTLQEFSNADGLIPPSDVAELDKRKKAVMEALMHTLRTTFGEAHDKLKEHREKLAEMREKITKKRRATPLRRLRARRLRCLQRLRRQRPPLVGMRPQRRPLLEHLMQWRGEPAFTTCKFDPYLFVFKAGYIGMLSAAYESNGKSKAGGITMGTLKKYKVQSMRHLASSPSDRVGLRDLDRGPKDQPGIDFRDMVAMQLRAQGQSLLIVGVYMTSSVGPEANAAKLVNVGTLVSTIQGP
ncbi:unnamed protein product, partial [Prorocentrum cordatum]